MRKCEETTTIKVSKEIRKRIEKDRLEFERLIGGGKWSVNDTIKEYYKILKTLKNKKVKRIGEVI